MRWPTRICTVAVTALTVVACGGGSDAPGSVGFRGAPTDCSAAREKQFVLDQAREWYLFLELLPASIDANAYATADDLLDALTATARAQGKDRFFSYLSSIAQEQDFFAEGTSVGFGFGSHLQNSPAQLFVTQVFPASAASSAGFIRGDEILAIGSSPSTLQSVVSLAAQAGGISQALGAAEAGIVRTLQVRTRTGAVVDRTMTKSTFSLDPVPPEVIIARPGLTPIGYLNLRTFVSPADAPLRAAFGRFRAQNVRDIIIDLRYNGGGLVATAEILGSLLAGGNANDVLYRTRLNAQKASQEEIVRVLAEPNAIPAVRIAFLATGASASASELVINALAPYADTSIIGATTYGKPVGQYGFDLPGCDTRLRLVTFKTENRDGGTDFFDGLPDARYTDSFCPAADDVSHAQGSPLEAMTAEGIFWLTNARCTVAAASQGSDLRESVAGFPLPLRPTAAQVFQPGLF